MNKGKITLKIKSYFDLKFAHLGSLVIFFESTFFFFIGVNNLCNQYGYDGPTLSKGRMTWDDYALLMMCQGNFVLASTDNDFICHSF